MNIRPYININGVSSQSIQGLLISSLPPISKPPIRTNFEEVDGRDGDIVTVLGYGAYDKPVNIGLTYDYDIDAIIKYFDSNGVVTFSNEPDKYYRFAIYEAIDFERLINFKTAEVIFHCQPFKFSLQERVKEFSISENPATLSIFNAGNVYSRPVISITGSGTVIFSLNGNAILNIELGDTPQTIIIDCERFNAYNSTRTVLLNRLVTGNYDNIKIEKGANTIGLTGNVSAFTIDKFSRWI